ncbi:MAG: hypothetical protein AB3N24_05980 [Leisingera sp.]
MAKKFSAQVAEFSQKTKRNMRYVAAEAIQDVVEAAQTTQLGITRGAESFEEGKIPVGLTGDLVNALVSSIDGGASGAGAASYATVIAGMELGDRLTFTWTQEYAMRIEAGFTGTDAKGRQYNQSGRHFVGANAARFQDFVDARSNEVQGR